MNGLVGALPLVLALVAVETLLSLDNSLAIATIASHLRGKRRAWALRIGLIGACVLRAAGLALVHVIIEHPWIKIAGGLYLIGLACQDLSSNGASEPSIKGGKAGFMPTVLTLIATDAAFSIDNIVAAAAFSPDIWVVYAGVFVGMLGMWIVANLLIGSVHNHPGLSHLAYALIGYVGLELVATELTGWQAPGWCKPAVLVLLSAGWYLYTRVPSVRKLLRPVLSCGSRGLVVPARIFGALKSAIRNITRLIVPW